MKQKATHYEYYNPCAGQGPSEKRIQCLDFYSFTFDLAFFTFFSGDAFSVAGSSFSELTFVFSDKDLSDFFPFLTSLASLLPLSNRADFASASRSSFNRSAFLFPKILSRSSLKITSFSRSSSASSVSPFLLFLSTSLART